ncbi:MAG: hypothetical protein AXW14_12610 [Alteromonas sp. Nap_26]|nr:MAG: hypothetical protein AXW14_12610 [Alteromonas sp. Nap_26]
MIRYIIFLILSTVSFSLYPHELSNAYLVLRGESNEALSGELSLKPEDIGQAAGLDTDNNGKLTWGEVITNQNLAINYIQNHLIIRDSQSRCSLSITLPTMQNISAESLLVYPLAVNCTHIGEISVQYSGIISDFPTHKLLTSVTIDDHTNIHVLDSERASITIAALGTASLAQFGEMVFQGIWHIFIGLDHILFLVATLLTVNLQRKNQKWVKALSKKLILKNTIILVSTFTLAHSITLTATALDLIALNSRIVELGIAVSVAFTALNNMYPVIMRLGFITFGFGLLHGMGFASVFGELNAQSGGLLLNVLAFNLGVEVGQLVIVAMLMPVLLTLRNLRVYAKAIMPVASSIIAVIALNWTLQRW